MRASPRFIRMPLLSRCGTVVAMSARVSAVLLGASAALVAGARWAAMTRATPAEKQRRLPGDELVPEPMWQATRATTIGAPPEAVWPWLVQMGQGRGGFYSYDWVENLGGLDIHSADEIIPELQTLDSRTVRCTGNRLLRLSPVSTPSMSVSISISPARRQS